MKILLQRVASARVTVEGTIVGEIGSGLLLLTGVHRDDDRAAAEFLAQKCAELRVFSDAEGKMNRSAHEIQAAALVVSQFTLYGDCRKGRRPSFDEAAGPEKAEELYLHFVDCLRRWLPRVETGVFRAHMAVELVNDGPVTLLLEK